MDWNITSMFPIEIWEKIILFCDGGTLIMLSKMNKTLHDVIFSMDQRRKIWKRRCIDEISNDERVDFRHKLYPNRSIPTLWSDVYKIWYMWQNVSKCIFKVVKVPNSYLDITDIKVSNEIIIVGDKTGFAVVNSVTGKRKKFKVGPVRRLELLVRRQTKRPEGTEFLHDILDCTIGNYHLFFDLHRMLHLRCDKHENEVLRYCFGRKKSKFTPPVLDADVFNDLILYVTKTSIRQAVYPMNVISEIHYSWTGARCWYLWHASLLLCCRDDSLDIYLNSIMKSFPFGIYPRMSAVFYFGNMLFLGSIHGSLYIYRIAADDIFSFSFDSYESKLDLGTKAIVAVEILENNSTNSCIIVATDNEIFRVFPETVSTCLPS